MKNNILDLIGNTPMIRIDGFENTNKLKARLFAKLEYFNPFGSIKDRAAFQIIKDAEEKEEIKQGFTVIEATSGNMGVALTAISSLKGYKSLMVMPDNTSKSKKELMKKYGAKIILTSATDGMRGSLERVKEIINCNEKMFYVNQFENASSVTAHKNTTAPEIYSQMNGRIDAVIAGIGSGGTITGIAEYLKSVNRSIEIIGVLPKSLPNNIQGIGSGFIPNILNMDLLNSILYVTDEEAEKSREILSKTDSVFIGPSSGAVISAGKKLGSLDEYQDKNIVMIFADSGERYI